MNIKKLEKELTITSKDRASITQDDRNMIILSMGVSTPTFTSNFAFSCKCCAEIAPHLNPYQIIKEDKYIEGNLEGLSEILSLVDLKNIFRIKKGKEPEYKSYLNYVEGVGVVCDHCFESVYSDE
jgi:hypothetical protein